jgi:hypothetical protein
LEAVVKQIQQRWVTDGCYVGLCVEPVLNPHDPESGVVWLDPHPAKAKEKVEKFQDVLFERTFATNNPSVVDVFDAEHVWCIARYEGRTFVAPLSAHPDWEEGMATGAFWVSVGEEWVLNAPESIWVACPFVEVWRVR